MMDGVAAHVFTAFGGFYSHSREAALGSIEKDI